MIKNELETIINQAWDKREEINKDSDKKIIDAINQTVNDLDSGASRVAEKIDGSWITHQYLKKAIMLSFRIYDMEALSGPYSSWYDKSHLSTFRAQGVVKLGHILLS